MDMGAEHGGQTYCCSDEMPVCCKTGDDLECWEPMRPTQAMRDRIDRGNHDLLLR